jgi:hypothetical protein
MLLSFVSIKRLGGSKYVLLMTILVALISFFSAFSILRVIPYGSTYYFAPNPPIPLSFPLYASLDTDWLFDASLDFPPRYGFYELHFLTLEIGDLLFPFTSDLLILFYSLFILVNIIGAIIGYWIGKSTLSERLIKTSYLLKDQAK